LEPPPFSTFNYQRDIAWGGGNLHLAAGLAPPLNTQLRYFSFGC
jgi:hypothetical protein